MTNDVTPTRDLFAVCDSCHQPVDPGDGYLHVSHAEIREHESAKRGWEKANPPGQAVATSTLLEMPGPARWHCHHRSCDPDIESNDYWIDVAVFQTWEGLVARTAHLAQKNWFISTDWIKLLEGVVYGTKPGVGRLNQVV